MSTVIGLDIVCNGFECFNWACIQENGSKSKSCQPIWCCKIDYWPRRVIKAVNKSWKCIPVCAEKGNHRCSKHSWQFPEDALTASEVLAWSRACKHIKIEGWGWSWALLYGCKDFLHTMMCLLHSKVCLLPSEACLFRGKACLFNSKACVNMDLYLQKIG